MSLEDQVSEQGHMIEKSQLKRISSDEGFERAGNGSSKRVRLRDQRFSKIPTPTMCNVGSTERTPGTSGVVIPLSCVYDSSWSARKTGVDRLAEGNLSLYTHRGTSTVPPDRFQYSLLIFPCFAEPSFRIFIIAGM